MSQLRVGHLNFCNAIPLYTSLSSAVQLVGGVPSELNALLREGKLDLSLVSSFEYLSHSSLYDLLPGYCIAAEGQVRSVHLHVKGPLAALNDQPLALTPQSASSAQLVKLFCRYFWHIRPHFVTLPHLNQCMDYKAFLLIGDQALLHPGFPGYTRFDLAQVWKEKTDLPITFAVFAMRKRLMQERGEEVLGFC
ncbi:MAG: menaquinone biosynthesis protein, partial [Verrucomicrobia bacterium]|nr:menaquinone biosynthesis protein [Verrucomicrobiota bacterium]